MRTWRRADIVTLCGGPCKGSIPVGAPLFEMRITGLSKIYRRCAACAGEPVPDDLPLRQIQAAIEPRPLTRLGHVKLPFDYKSAAAGREPGEEG